MIYFAIEEHMLDPAVKKELLSRWESVTIISSKVKKDGHWNSLMDKLIHYWRSYLLLSLKVLKKSKQNDILITWQVFVGVVTGLMIKIFKIRRELIILSFIYRPRSNTFINHLRYLITRVGLSVATKIICYSRYEVEKYTALFNLKSGKFYFAELGRTYSVIPTTLEEKGRYIFTAGQSNRDFNVLIKSIYDIDIKLLLASTNKIKISEELKSKVVVKELHGEEFQSVLKKAFIIVIPLKDTDYSSGQIVLINAMAAGKCVIITETEWSQDYIRHGENAWLVPPGDEQKLGEAIMTIINNDELRKKIEINARRTYEAKLNGKEFSKRIAKIIKE